MVSNGSATRSDTMLLASQAYNLSIVMPKPIRSYGSIDFPLQWLGLKARKIEKLAIRLAQRRAKIRYCSLPAKGRGPALRFII
jgi:hypothetical protein